MNEQNEKRIDAEQESSVLTAPQKRKPPKSKRSLLKKQRIALIVLALLTVLLIIGVAVFTALNKTDVLDTYTERKDGITYVYTSRLTETVNDDGETVRIPAITDENAVILETVYIDGSGMLTSDQTNSSKVYKTAFGTLLKTDEQGKISIAYKVDDGNYETSIRSNPKLLIHKQFSSDGVLDILIHNKDKNGNVNEFTIVGEDSNSLTLKIKNAGSQTVKISRSFLLDGQYSMSLYDASGDEEKAAYTVAPHTETTLYLPFTDGNANKLGSHSVKCVYVIGNESEPRYFTVGFDVTSNHNGLGNVTASELEQGLTVSATLDTGSFSLKGYERSTVDQLSVYALSALAGFPLVENKLSLEYMQAYDNENADKDGYAPLLDSNGNIRFAEYGISAENSSYYVVTLRNGESYRVYLGSKCPNGIDYYAAYMNSDGTFRNAVYRISNNNSASQVLGSDISRERLFLGAKENFVSPQLIYAGIGQTEALMAEGIRIYRADPEGVDGYNKVIDVSYIDLDARNYTIDQLNTYKLNGDSTIKGYVLDSDKISSLLLQLSKTADSRDGLSSSGNDYVKTVAVLPDILGDIQIGDYSTAAEYRLAYDVYCNKIIAASETAFADKNSEIGQILAEYGLDTPAYKFFSSDTSLVRIDATTSRQPIAFNCLYISEKTENGTYYVYAPMYQQLLEVGYQYMNFVEYDTFDYVKTNMFDSFIYFCDSIRVNGADSAGDQHDIRFELFNSYKFAWEEPFVNNYSSIGTAETVNIEGSTFRVTVGQLYDDAIAAANNRDKYRQTLKITSEIKFSALLQNGTRQTFTFSPTITNDNLSVVKEAMRWYANGNSDAYFNQIPDIFKNDVLEYSKSSDYKIWTYDKNTGTATLTLRLISDRAALEKDSAAFACLKDSRYTIKYSYNKASDMLSVRVGQEKRNENGAWAVLSQNLVEVYNERTYREAILSKVTDRGTETGDTTPSYYVPTLTDLSTTQDLLIISEYGENGELTSAPKFCYSNTDEGKKYIDAFKMFYQTLLFAKYNGKANEADTVSGVRLTDEQMRKYENGEKEEDLALTLNINMTVNGLGYTYRMYGYSSTKSFTTLQQTGEEKGNGIFYLFNTRVQKIVNDAVKVTKGDPNISSDSIY